MEKITYLTWPLNIHANETPRILCIPLKILRESWKQVFQSTDLKFNVFTNKLNYGIEKLLFKIFHCPKPKK